MYLLWNHYMQLQRAQASAGFAHLVCIGVGHMLQVDSADYQRQPTRHLCRSDPSQPKMARSWRLVAGSMHTLASQPSPMSATTRLDRLASRANSLCTTIAYRYIAHQTNLLRNYTRRSRMSHVRHTFPRTHLGLNTKQKQR